MKIKWLRFAQVFCILNAVIILMILGFFSIEVKRAIYFIVSLIYAFPSIFTAITLGEIADNLNILDNESLKSKRLLKKELDQLSKRLAVLEEKYSAENNN